ncbi:MAG: hypothetical protein LBT85_00670 [Bifidobacteriaceae bacterium]|jgi:uncharacterized protein (TIGR02145 family)|nr:hypothetical protein [Bifidobacteriaceae bacterium]
MLNFRNNNFRKIGILGIIFFFCLTYFLNNSFPANASSQSVLNIAKGGTNANNMELAQKNLGRIDSISYNSTDNQFPSSKAIYDYIQHALYGNLSIDNTNFSPTVTNWTGGDLIYKSSELSTTAANNKIKIDDVNCATSGQGYTNNSAAGDSTPQIGCVLPSLAEGTHGVKISTDGGANYSIYAGAVNYKQTPALSGCDTTSMQTFSANAANCKAAMQQGQVIVLNDPRGNSDNPNGQKYRVKKMPDGNVWMVDNLKLGSTTSTTALTPTNTNITADYTLPAVTNKETNSYCIPSGDVWKAAPGSFTGCGYLYNWQTTMAGTASESGFSISAKGWSFPSRTQYATLVNSITSAGADSSGARNPVYSTDSYLNFSGPNSPWQGVWVGFIYANSSGDYNNQGAGSFEGYWSTTQGSSTGSWSWYLYFDASSVLPTGDNRYDDWPYAWSARSFL